MAATASSPVEEDVFDCFDRYDKIPTKNSVAYIFSNVTFRDNETREASTQDNHLFKEALINLGFRAENIKEYVDMETSDIPGKFDEDFDYPEIDCFVCAILSYMLPENRIRTYDKAIPLNKILRCVEDSSYLKDKPKLMFVVTTPRHCDNAIEKCDADTIGFEEEHTTPRTADMLVVCSSSDNTTRSSYFMKFLHKVLEECGNKYDIMTILAAVSNCIKEEIESNEQMPCIMSTLTKQLKFERSTNNTV
ncbi:caspase-1-like isoform X2 [Octopus vulgaris]|uniref:Caspase-1-like isoform X2 n=1 Tax=Octopus vulgaris TaxID=6645 RepID=A0AA36F7P6_OCTVU|nr:caspase-1-like isoform X2 [Octopus vulgaris]